MCTPPSIQFYADLQLILKKKRVDVETIGMIYRSIDPYIRQFTASSKDAYQLITKFIDNYDAADNDQTGSETQTYGSTKMYEIHCKLLSQENVQLQNTLKQQRRIIDKQSTEIEHLKLQLSEFQCLVKEKNCEIRKLSSAVYNLEHANDEFVLELNEYHNIFQKREKQFEAE